MSKLKTKEYFLLMTIWLEAKLNLNLTKAVNT